MEHRHSQYKYNGGHYQKEQLSFIYREAFRQLELNLYTGGSGSVQYWNYGTDSGCLTEKKNQTNK